MSSVEQVRQQLVDAELMTNEAIDGHIARWRQEPGASAEPDGQALIAWLVGRQLLTEFQAEALWAGHTGPFLLGPYRVFGRVAMGRLGNTYRAVHADLLQPVSLKVFPTSLNSDPEKLARIQREISMSAELDHPNIVRLYQMGQVGDIYYLAFEDLQGETLQDRLDREGRLPYPTACRLTREAAFGLAYLHDKSLVHRDVRPANLWITEGGSVKMMELGAVRSALVALDGADDGSLTTNSTVLGTYDYTSPEQARHAHGADHRSDIYSLGCTLYHCLTGHPPFVEKNPIRMVMRHAGEAPAPVTDLAPDVPPELAETVATMLAKSPDERFQSMTDVALELEQHAEPSGLEEDEEGQVLEGFLASLRESEGPATEESRGAGSSGLSAFLGWLADRR